MSQSSSIAIAEKILSDILNDEPVSSILLKAKIYASRQHDIEMLEWINKEINGYDDNLPSYRVLDAAVKVDVHKGFQEILGFSYPIDLVDDDNVRKRLSHIPILIPLAQVEEMAKKNDGTINLEVPAFIWYNHMTHCINGDIQRAYQYADSSALCNIITSVKSILIDFFSKIEENNEIEFSAIMKHQETITVNNNAAIINTGDGTVNASGVNNIIGNDNYVTSSCIPEFQSILEKLDAILGHNEDYKEISKEVSVELSKPSPSMNIIKRGFQAIKGLAYGVATEVVVGQINELVEQALSLM